MIVESFSIEGQLLIQPTSFEDDRGLFFESYNHSKFQEETQQQIDWVQDNESYSEAGVLRGMHFQKEPHGQDKLVRVTQGKVLDVVIDIRPESATFGQHLKVVLSAENRSQLFIPKGFAHGFLALEPSQFLYKCSSQYYKESECCIRFDDPDLMIEWGIEEPIMSGKDKEGVSWREFVSEFLS
ncbi:MAG: dTDP-4-dehydrorhamnose 3,5-epimerase [Flavobacteriales bacterium]|nr:dTDP-4-dehydrorhamnose 3,5-epimerase [Flavobacteriales bacterium]